jgi:hypothetical protein|tara:strand:+ start:195 stop:380 length:186 start_codon:yes stop_codon:yes gene_type:complete
MTKNLWQRERNNVFRHLVKQYINEGYSTREARSLAKQELDEVMEDKEDFVKTLWKESFSDV